MDTTQIGRIVIDIETAPLDDAAQYIEPSSAPSHYKDPLKIIAFRAEADAEALSKCSLDPDLCRVVAVGWWVEGEGEPGIITARNVTEEASLLSLTWQAISERIIVGHNVLQFDLPVLFRRSLYLGVPAPQNIELGKYRHARVFDTMQFMSGDGTRKYRSLAFYAKRFGLPAQPDTITGADIGGCVARHEWAKIHEHVEADVRTTAALAERLTGFRCGEMVL